MLDNMINDCLGYLLRHESHIFCSTEVQNINICKDVFLQNGCVILSNFIVINNDFIYQ